MKNKKLIGQLEFIKQYECKTDAEKKAIDKAIKILGQQPNEDCISREAVMHILDEVSEDFDTPREAIIPIDCIADMVADLSSVTSQPKIGKWIAQDIHNCHTDFKCSECGYIHSFMHLYGEPTADYTYCPNCGAKMEGEK